MWVYISISYYIVASRLTYTDLAYRFGNAEVKWVLGTLRARNGGNILPYAFTLADHKRASRMGIDPTANAIRE